MRLVLASLARPVTLLVALFAILLTGTLALRRMPVDIFPQVGDPAIYVAQPYGGMDPAQMEGYLTYYFEYHFLYITGIDHVESKSIQGAALMKLVFHAGTDMSQAMAETVGYVNRARAFMPPGAVPPFITRFDAGSVAVGQLVFASNTHSQGELQDFALNRVRPLFATLPGVSAPPPFGGNQRTIVVTLDPDKLRQYRVSPDEAVSAITSASLVVPSGNIWTGDIQNIARTNAALGPNLSELMNAPIHPGHGPAVYLRDLGFVENGTDVVTAYAHVNGKRTVYIPVTKRADASALRVINAVRSALPDLRAAVPADVDIRLEFDQSPVIIGALRNLGAEGVFGAVLTGLIVLLFLRDWRSALIVILNIPVALLSAVVLLWIAGQTINIMTVSGLALAVGILVDEATVEVENIHHRIRSGVSRARAVVDACRRTASARLLSMLCVLAVFITSFFMQGVARQLFVPLSLAVAFAIVSSYFLSGSLVPVFSVWIMRPSAGRRTPWWETRIASAYNQILRRLLGRKWLFICGYLAIALAAIALLAPALHTEIFPPLDSPLLRMRMRAPTGTRVEEMERVVLRALASIDSELGHGALELTSDYVGVVPSSYPVDLIHLFTSGPHEAVIQLSLRKSRLTGSLDAIRERLRHRLRRDIPQIAVSFEAADIVSQVMSFGSPTPVEVAVQGISLDTDYAFAAKLRSQLSRISFLRDLQLAQSPDFPTVDITVDRERAGQLGLTLADVARSLVPATSSTRFTQPNYWRDPNTGNAFQIQVQIPQNRMQSTADLTALPVMRNGQSDARLSDVAVVKTGRLPGLIERLNGQHIVSLTANLHGIALGAAARPIVNAIQAAGTPPRGVTVRLRGEIPALLETQTGLRAGLLVAIGAVFLLLTAYFQSVRLAAAIVLTVPAVLCGSLLALFLTDTTLNIQSFIGLIMATGIATANSILLVTFAERERLGGQRADEAALNGASGRWRAVLMTATAMIAGMLPLAVGLGENGSQAAPLGRAVIGGLLASTLTTLLVLPPLYAVLQRRASLSSLSLNPADPGSAYHDA